MPLKIVQYGDPVLRQKGVKVTAFDATLKKFAKAMIEALHAAKGVGLAAQQVGEALQVCIIDSSVMDDSHEWDLTFDGRRIPGNLLMPLVLINPELKLFKEITEIIDEGCLSINHGKLRGEVERPVKISCKYQDLDGVAHEIISDNFIARIIQHEVDHLNGLMFIDRMTKSDLKKIQPELDGLKNG